MASTRLRYRPELDGLRAMAVIAVLMFHAEVPGFSGGYLGVSLFFTLSGFLITGLLLAEEHRDGSIDLASFYVRRARRLLPASLVCLAAIAVISWSTDWFNAVANLRRDLLGAALQVANWVSLAGEGSYQNLFADAAGQSSPVEHYWSLAIEEQFYWIWPLVFVVAARRVRTPKRRLVLIAATTVAAGLAAPLIATIWSADAAYWATPARASEILAGALVAVVVHGQHLRRIPRVVWRWSVPVGLTLLATAVLLFPSSGGPAFAGALPLVAVVSAVVLLGLARSDQTLTHRTLSTGALVGLGRISYGVYLFHWPIFVVVDQPRVDLDGVALLTLRLGLTLAAALVSYYALERPIRIRPPGRPSRVASWSIGATAGLIGISIAFVPAGVGDYWRSSEVDEAAAAVQIVPPGTAKLAPLVPLVPATSTAVAPTTATSTPNSSTPVVSDPPPLPQLERPIRIIVGGDSTAEALGAGVALWAVERPDLAQVNLLASPGCGVLREGEILLDDWRPVASACAEWFGARFIAEVEALRPDVVMLHTTSWDVLDHRWSDGIVRSPFDPVFADRLEADFADLTDRLLASGVARVIWVRQPAPNVYWLSAGQAQEDPRRHQVVYSAMDAVADSHPETVSVVDLPSWLEGAGLLDDQTARPDGVHWAPEAAAQVAREFLGEQLVRITLGLE